MFISSKEVRYTNTPRERPHHCGREKTMVAHSKGRVELFHILMLIGLFLSLCFAVITLHVPGSLLASFVVQELGWTVADGSFLTAVFYGSFCIGRLISLPLSLAVSPATLLLCGMCTAVSGYILMLVVCHLLPVYVYLSVAVVGLGQSSIIGSLYVWASNHMSLSGRDTGILQCGFSMGEMGAQPLTAYLFETYTPMWLIYVCIGGELAHPSCVRLHAGAGDVVLS